MVTAPFYEQVLRDELARRSARNPRYSLRSFARSLRLDAGALSRILNGKQPLSVKAAHAVLPHLELEPAERRRFLLSAAEKKGKSALAPEPDSDAVIEIETERFRVVSDVLHSALLELTCTKDFSPDLNRIAARLGTTPLEAKLALDRLERLGLLRRHRGTYRKTAERFAVANKDVSQPALRRLQKQILALGSEALSTVPIEKRVANSMTLALDPDQIPLARRMIVDFCRALTDALECGRRRKVYQLQVQLFPLEKENDA